MNLSILDWNIYKKLSIALFLTLNCHCVRDRNIFNIKLKKAFVFQTVRVMINPIRLVMEVEAWKRPSRLMISATHPLTAPTQVYSSPIVQRNNMLTVPNQYRIRYAITLGHPILKLTWCQLCGCQLYEQTEIVGNRQEVGDFCTSLNSVTVTPPR